MFRRSGVHSVAGMTTFTDTHLQSHRVSGGGGCQLYVEETGNREGPPVLFIHGVSQSRLAWRRQLNSELGRNLRLVAVDLRGHGRSDCPHDAYSEPFLWADDIQAVITSLGLDRPILCGWSYGGIIIGDYLRCHGERALGGIVLVAAASRLGEPAMPFLGPDFVSLLPGLASNTVEESNTALQALVGIFTETAMEAEDFYSVLGYNAVVPPHVRQAMLSRTVDYDDVFARLEAPTLIVQGLADRVVLPAMSRHQARLIPHAQASYYPATGHTPFREHQARFDAELLAFAETT
jgi:pimeloyl-ACP methyl ester carboxylesterase